MSRELEAIAALIPRLDRLTAYLERDLERSTALDQALRGGQVDGVLQVGMVQTDATGRYEAEFAVPYASITIADVTGIGAISASTDGAEDALLGSIQVPRDYYVTAPLKSKQIHVLTTSVGKFLLVVWAKPQAFAMGVAF